MSDISDYRVRQGKKKIQVSRQGDLTSGELGGSRGGMEIRKLTKEALPAVQRLAGVIWRQHYPGIITDGQIEYMLARMYDLDVMRREMMEQGIVYEGLFLEGRMIGFCSHGRQPDPADYKLHKLYVLAQHHGSGRGSAALRHVEQQAKAAGCRFLMLTVNKRNEKALRSYRANGFRVRDGVVADIGHGYVMDDYVMEKGL
jgi:GNAT superfamily N-acetyltransferase